MELKWDPHQRSFTHTISAAPSAHLMRYYWKHVRATLPPRRSGATLVAKTAALCFALERNKKDKSETGRGASRLG